MSFERLNGNLRRSNSHRVLLIVVIARVTFMWHGDNGRADVLFPVFLYSWSFSNHFGVVQLSWLAHLRTT